jgi:transcriptional regulator with XRE-family HTH domain
MEKTKLIEARKSKRLSQQQIADFLCMDVSNYNRRENGEVYIKIEHWEKLAKFLDVPLSEIYEADEKQFNSCSDNASGNFIGTNFGPNNIYTTSEVLIEMLQKHIETQQKYIAKLEKEIEELNKLIK